VKRVIFIGISIFTLLLFLSCSQGNITSPRANAELRNNQPQVNENAGGRVLWGLWQFSGDTRTGKLEAVPLRYGMIHLNALAFLEPPPNMLLKVSGIKVIGNQGNWESR
jgi:hypothetical protein